MLRSYHWYSPDGDRYRYTEVRLEYRKLVFDDFGLVPVTRLFATLVPGAPL